MSDWLPTDDAPERDGVVEVRSVRDAQGRDGVRVELVDPEHRDAFRAFYDGLRSAAVHLLDRGDGFVVFAATEEARPRDVAKLGVRAIDAVDRLGDRLRGLSPNAIAFDDRGDVHLRPRFRVEAGPPPLKAVGAFLESLDSGGEHHDAIVALLDTSPEVRRTARSLLLGRPQGSTNPPVKLTVAAPERQSRGQLDVAEARGAVVLSADALADLSPAQRSAAAGLAGLPLVALQGLQAAGLPLVLESHRRANVSRVRARQLQETTGLPVVAATGGGALKPLFGLGLVTTAIATGMGAASFAMLGLTLTALFGAALTLSMLGVAAWMGVAWSRDRGLLTAARQSEREAHEERERQARDPALARAWSALNEARASLAAAAALPGAASSDLRDVLKAAEQELEALARIQETVRKGLATTSSASVRDRLAGLGPDDPTVARRRTALERTLQEIEQLEQRGEQVVEEAHTLESVLTEVAGSIARWEAEPEEPAMQAVIQATRTARQRRRAAQ